MTDRDDRIETRNRLAKLAFGIAAIVCLGAGLVIYLFHEALGIDRGTAEIVAIALLAAGVGDYVLLRFWDRLVRPR